MHLDTSLICLNISRPVNLVSGAVTESPMDIGTCGDVGRVRENNEDSLGVAPELSLFVLSDGMGGQACGEIASRLAVDTVLTYCRETQAAGTTSDLLARSIRMANRIVHTIAQEDCSHRGMGATIVAVQWTGEHLSVAHVGDSRVYRLRQECLEQLTQDHSFAMEQMRLGRLTEAEANSGGLQNILTRAVGIEAEVEVETKEEHMLIGDIVLLCSDGLTRELSDKQIATILRDTADAQEAANELVNLANQAGGGDNISVIVIRRISQTRGVLSRGGLLGRWFKLEGIRS